MAGVNAMGAGIQAMAAPQANSGGNPRLQALERKLSQLKDEKEKAVRNKDKEKEKKLEEEIKNVEKQIEQLKLKEKQKKEQGNKGGQEEAEDGQNPGPYASLGLGGMIDVYG